MILTLVLAILIIAIYLIKLDYFFQFLPTLSWTLFMFIPYLYSKSYFPNKADQLTGITLILFFFLIGDLISSKLKKNENKNANYKINFGNFSGKYLNLLSFITLVIPVVHFVIVGNVPIYSLIFEHKPLSTLRESRYEFNRDSIPYWFAMCSNYISYLIGPIVLILTAAKRKYLRFIFMVLWLGFYTISSGAKLSLVFCTFTLILIGMNTVWKRYKRILSFGILLIFLFTVLSGMLLGNLAVSKAESCPLPAGANFSPANVLRSCPEGKNISLNPVSDTLGYRVFLTPVEVSNNWYSYFSQNKKRTVPDVLERENDKKASNIIANQFYAKFWPDRYPSITNANTSVDADSFSIGGTPFIFFIGLILLVIRLIISTNNSLSNSILVIFEGAGVASLTVLPFSASIQAILLPNGLWLVIFVILVIKLRYFWTDRINI